MKCPRCHDQSPDETVRCATCRAPFNARQLEELGHLSYLRRRLDEWRAEGLVPTEVADRALRAAGREVAELELRLGPRPAAPMPETDQPSPPARTTGSAIAVLDTSDTVAPGTPRATAPPSTQSATDLAGVTAPTPAAPGATPSGAVRARTGFRSEETPAPVRPAFAWRQAGTYLLSERTLHALLGLGAFLILAAGAVISTLNPTALAPLPHLGVVAATTALFYGAGYVVRRRLRLATTGAALLAIGAAFIPLLIWTLGQPDLLGWQPGAIWLAASLLCLPAYLASYAALRDRTFAVLTALAGGSELLAASHWLGVPLEWGFCALIALAAGYLLLARRCQEGWELLGRALLWSAQVATSLIMAALLLSERFPPAWEVAARAAPGAWFGYAVAGAWWLGWGFYALASRLYRRRRYRVLAAWTPVVAFLLTLAQTGLEAGWYNLGLALLALSYLLYGHARSQPDGAASPTIGARLGQPIYQAAFGLTVLAALWRGTPDSALATLVALSAVYAMAAVLLRQRACAYVAVYLLPPAWALTLQRLGLDGEVRPLAWIVLAGALLAAAEGAARRSREGRRSLVETVLGLGAWRSRFAAPCFSAGYAAGLVALGVALGAYWGTPGGGLARAVDSRVLLAFLAIVVGCALSARARRTSAFLYPACWLALIPFASGAALVAQRLGLPLPDHELARLLALLAPLYVGLGLHVRRIRRESRLPWYIGGYGLSALGPLLASPEPGARIFTLAVSIALYAASAHLFRRSGWLCLVALLTPILLWQVLEQLAVPDRYYGVGLVALGLAYGGLGVVLHHGTLARVGPIRGRVGAYARPFFLVGYALGTLGLVLVTGQDKALVLLGFALAALHHVGSALVFRRSVFGFPIAITAAVVYVVGMTMTPLDPRQYGMGLLPGIAAYLVIAETLRRRLDQPGMLERLRPRARLGLDSWSTPFYVTLYAGTVAVPFYATAEWARWWGTWWATGALAWWGIGAVYAASTALFRHPGWLYPTAGAGLVAWLATAFVLAPRPTYEGTLATLIVPVWLLYGLSYLIVRARTVAGPSKGSASGWAHPWSRPLLACGLMALTISTLGSLFDREASLVTAVADGVLLSLSAIAWQDRLDVWRTLALAGLAFQDALRVLDVPLVDQPPRWALAALTAVLVPVLIRLVRFEAVKLWRGPLELSSLGVGAAAMAAAWLIQLTAGGDAALGSLAATAAVTGLSLVAHGFNQRRRILGYLGIALLEEGYMHQLTLTDVGQPQAFVLPAGLYLLAIAYLEWRRGSGSGIKPKLEASALSLLLGTSLLQAVGFLGDGLDRYVYDTFLLLESVALLGLGSVLRWKRTFFAGGFCLVVDVCILLADPLRAVNTWYLVAMLGLAMIGTVVFIEQRRQQIPVWADEWRQRLETWE